MSPLRHQVKEFAERLSGLHLVFSRAFPFVRPMRRFLTVRLDLHNKCNLRCRMCYFALDEVWHDKLVELSDAVIGRLEREVWPRTRELWLSCATEPLIGRKLERVLPRAKAAGIPQVQLVTNGLALTEDRARLLIEGGLDRLSVSLDGATAETYEAIRTQSRFDRVLENIRRFQELKKTHNSSTPALTIRGVMMMRNLPEWPAIVRLAASLGADRVILQPQVHYTEFGAEDSLLNHPAEVDAALAASAAAARECAIALEAPAPRSECPLQPASAKPACAHCLAPWLSMIVYPDGEVMPCFQLYGHPDFGNFERQGFREIFYGPGYRRLREQLRSGQWNPVCGTCAAGAVDALGPDAAEKLERRIFPESPGTP